jgi:hypothetical protein
MTRIVAPALALLMAATGGFAQSAEANTPPVAAVSDEAAAERPVAPRRRARVQPPIPEPPPPAPPLPGSVATSTELWGEPAPIPNRSIEAPRDRFAGPPRPTLEPVIIDEREVDRGFTFGREHLSSRQEILGKDLVPGARLRIPLE